jgi:hypothetical protein
MFAYGIYAGEWWSKAAMLVLCALLAFAIWQKVEERTPFLLDPTATPTPRVSLSDGLVASLAFFVLQGVVMAIALGAGDDPSPTVGLVTVSFVTAGLCVVSGSLVVFGWRRVPQLRRELGFRGGSPWRATWTGIALGVLAAAAGHAYVLGMQDVTWFQEVASQALLHRAGAIDRVWFVVLAVVAAPVFEEFVFRGLVYRGLRASLPLPAAVLGSAAIFAIVHHPVSWAPVFAMGVCAALAFERTRLLWAPILVHAVYNAGALAAQV